MKTVLIRAPALSMSGYGEQARFLLRAIRPRAGKDIDLYIEDIPWGKSNKISALDEESDWIKSVIGKTALLKTQDSAENYKFDISIQITIPNEWVKIADYNIGYTAGIECDRVSAVWLQKASAMDKIITISQHSMDVYRGTTYEILKNKPGLDPDEGEKVGLLALETPIHCINYSVRSTGEPTDLDIELKTEFNFLTISQWGPRKNLDTLLGAFLEEFQNNSKVGLVIKIHTLNSSVLDKRRTRNSLKHILLSYPDRKCKIYLLHGELSEEELTALYRHPRIKAYVTTTHGEGFGLPMFEATCNALPVIAPDWSGQRDFLHGRMTEHSDPEPLFRPIPHSLEEVHKNAVWEGVIEPGSKWSHVTIENTRKAMREVYQKLPSYKKRAKALKKNNLKTFAEEKIFKQFNDLLFSDLDLSQKYEKELEETKEKILSIENIKERSNFLKKEIRKLDSQVDKLYLMKDSFKGAQGCILSCGPTLLENNKEKIEKLAEDTVCITVKQAFDLFGDSCDFHMYNCANFKEYDYTTNDPIAIESSTTPAALGECDINFFIQERNKDNSVSSVSNFPEWTFDKEPLLRPFGPGIMYESVFYLVEHLGLKEIVTVGWDNKNISEDMTKQHFYDKEGADFDREDFIHYNDVAEGTPPMSLIEEEKITAQAIGNWANWLKENDCLLKICSDLNPAVETIERILLK